MESRNEIVIQTRSCTDLDKELTSLLADGYRLDMIMPADAPRVALLSKKDQQVRLTTNPQSEISNPKSKGRAGMEYRDLIPDRLGGRLIASHIRINEAGDVPDYVHYHQLDFQMIYCKAGSIRVVYEDQGPPFVLNAGDCVLQPPGIRHRVLESSESAEVIEISSPAEHETWVEHEIALPTKDVNVDRDFSGQRFVRSVAASASWHSHGYVAYRDVGIYQACRGFADVRVGRFRADGPPANFGRGNTIFAFVLSGEVKVSGAKKTRTLGDGNSIVLPAGHAYTVRALTEAEVLEVSLYGL